MRTTSSPLRVVEAARGFVHAAREFDGADPAVKVDAANLRDREWHRLLVELEEPCDCVAGSCDNPANPEVDR